MKANVGEVLRFDVEGLGSPLAEFGAHAACPGLKLDASVEARLEEIHAGHHAPLAALKLAAFACDALRVLRAFEQHAQVSPQLERTLRSVCGDWRNPGGMDALGAISDVLGQAVADLGAAVERAVELRQGEMGRVARD